MFCPDSSDVLSVLQDVQADESVDAAANPRQPTQRQLKAVNRKVKAVMKRVATITKTYDPELQRIIEQYALASPETFGLADNQKESTQVCF